MAKFMPMVEMLQFVLYNSNRQLLT